MSTLKYCFSIFSNVPSAAASRIAASNFVYEQLPKKVQTPALVFCGSSGVYSFHDEPVYNDGAAWPDDAKIVMAQHLGVVRDEDLIRYYAGIGQNRHVYHFDRTTLAVTALGTVDELVRSADKQAATRPATRPQEK